MTQKPVKKPAKKPVSRLEELLYNQIVSNGLPDPVREYKFHKTRRWRADFAWPDRMLIVEVEGGTYGNRVICNLCHKPVMQRTGAGKLIPVFTGGRHNSASGFEADAEKYNTAQISGWRVIRVTGKMIKSGAAIEFIKEMLK